MDLVRHSLTLLLWGELEPNGFIDNIRNECKLNEQECTITLTILQQKLLDPLKEALDAVYNGPVVNANITTAQTTTIVPKPVQEIPSVQQNFKLVGPSGKQPSDIVDPLDMFDRAKNDVRTTSPKEEVPLQKEGLEESQKITTAGTKAELNREAKKELSVNSNPIKVNMAAVLGDEKNNNTLVLQDNQAITQLSQILKNNTPIIEREDLSLYVPNPENKEEAPKPLNPAAAENDTDEFPEEPLVPKPAISLTPSTMTLIDANVAKPKETTMGENISQSHLKFAQNNEQRIPANKSYSKLLDAMSQKPKNQPQIVTTLRDTFAHPDRYSVPQEPSKPKPKKYILPDENLVKSVIVNSSEKSSNKESNAIMEKEIDNDIINLAKDISQERGANGKKINPETRGPILYTKQKVREDDTFGHITSDKLGEKGKPKNSNIIDLS